MHIDSLVDGKEVVLDRKTNALRINEPELVWCKKCGAPYLSSRQACPYCGFTRLEEKIESELERAQKNVRRARGLDEPAKLTVGDLSVVKKDQRERRVEEGQRRLKNQERGLTVGDLSVCKGKDNRGLDQLYEGQRAYVEPQMSESQELIAEMQIAHAKKREESIKIKNLIIEQEQEKQIRRQETEARIRAERLQVERELTELLRKGNVKADVG